MDRIIVSDIFGRTTALEEFASGLQGRVQICDPYNTAMMNFESEDVAYSYFTAKIGLDAYTEMLVAKINDCSGPISLLGFSVGASAIWRLSAHPQLTNICGAVLFYSSQIRNFTELEPCFTVRLVFPQVEKQFSVSSLVPLLRPKKNVHIDCTPFRHGFMNPHSQNYHQQAYDRYRQALGDMPDDKCFTALTLDSGNSPPIS